MTDSKGSRLAAQDRVDQIAAFRAEVAQLTREGGPSLDSSQLAAIVAHQDAVMAGLTRDFDVDRTSAARRMSRGMQIASVFGAAALVAAIVSFFYRVWGELSPAAQVLLLTAAPVAALGAMVAAGRIEKTRYVASLCAIVACGAFVLETVALGRMFNMRDSPHALAFWAAFAFAVAVPWRFVVPFALGVLSLTLYLAGGAFELMGHPWTNVMQRPELLMLSAALLLPLASKVEAGLTPVARGVLLILALLPLLVLSSVEGTSLIPINGSAARVGYQILALVVAVAVIAFALVRGQAETLAIGAVFAGLFLLTRFVDWWWDWMPKYLFFLILAVVALGSLWGLRLARRRLEAAV
jgi:hypothetical protein